MKPGRNTGVCSLSVPVDEQAVIIYLQCARRLKPAATFPKTLSPYNPLLSMFENLFIPSYWFTLQPALVGGTEGKIIFSFFVLLFLLGIVARIVSSNRTDDRHVREVFERGATLLVTMGILGVLLYFFSYEQIRLFGSRFWYLFWLIGILVWSFFLLRFVRSTIPKQRANEALKAEQRKYFPPRRKK